jgi:hypothetical protein
MPPEIPSETPAEDIREALLEKADASSAMELEYIDHDEIDALQSVASP